jgi:hypothetical protein
MQGVNVVVFVMIRYQATHAPARMGTGSLQVVTDVNLYLVATYHNIPIPTQKELARE